MINSEKIYRLVDIFDRQGNRRIEQESCKDQGFYKSLVGCIVRNIRESKSLFFDGTIAFVSVVQDPNGTWINRNFRTSPLEEIRELDHGGLELVTENSVYCFEPADLIPPVYLEESLLIELYMTDHNDQFCNGFYYDENKQPHQLACNIHLGMFQDSVLIRCADNYTSEYVCRYFPRGKRIEFYNTLYGEQDYSCPMLIHNTSNQPLQIMFEGFQSTWTIQPGESKRIIPFCADGADWKPT